MKKILLTLAIFNLAAFSKEVLLKGSVKDPFGKAVDQATILVKDNKGKIIYKTKTNSKGDFKIRLNTNLPLIEIITKKKDYEKTVLLEPTRSSKALGITLKPKKEESLTFLVKRSSFIRKPSFKNGNFSYPVDRKALEHLPGGLFNQNQQILLQFPGIVQDTGGQVHIRGDHANVQYRINGIYLPIGITGFGQDFDFNIASNINYLTGVLPPKYGLHTAGIIDITTKTFSKPQGSIGFMGGSYNTFRSMINFGSTYKKLSYYFEGSYLTNSEGLNPPTKSPIHDNTHQQNGFFYSSYSLDSTKTLYLFGGFNHSFYEIPNNNDPIATCAFASLNGSCYTYGNLNYQNYPVYKVNDTQKQDFDYLVTGIRGSPSFDTNYTISFFGNYAKIHYIPDIAGDLIYTGSAANTKYTDSMIGTQMDFSHKIGKHTIGFGFYFQGENAEHDINTYAFKADQELNQLSTTPNLYIDSAQKLGYIYSFYIQDKFDITKKLSTIYGLRFDQLDEYVKTNQVSPRLSFIYKLTKNISYHISYGRYFTPPPMLLVSGKNIDQLYGTTADAATAAGLTPNEINTYVLPERSSYYDTGIEGSIYGINFFTDAYFKEIHDALDDGQFGTARILSPFNYKHGKEYGLDSGISGTYKNLSYYLNLSLSVAKAENAIDQQYNFTAEQLSYLQNHYIYMDHDQTVTLSSGIYYKLPKDLGLSADFIYGSGLATGNYPPNSTHLHPYNQVNVGIDKTFKTKSFGNLKASFYVVNLFDNVYKIRDQGIGVYGPQYGPERSYYFSLTKTF